MEKAKKRADPKKSRARNVIPSEMETAESKARRIGIFLCWKCGAKNYKFRSFCWRCGEKEQ